MQILIVADDLDGGVPDVLGRKLARPVNQRQHHIHVPMEVWEKPASRGIIG